MTNKTSVKLLISALLVLLYLMAGIAIACDIHGLDQPPPVSCPLCAASQVISFSEHTIPVLSVCMTGVSVITYYPVNELLSPIPACMDQYANRAPPKLAP